MTMKPMLRAYSTIGDRQFSSLGLPMLSPYGTTDMIQSDSK